MLSAVADSVIRTYNLTKRYGNAAVVDRLTLTVPRGGIYGFLGLNGAGKTTTIRMLLGLVSPTSGRVEVLGHRVVRGRRQPLARVGALVGIPRFYPNLTARENLELVRRLAGIEPARRVDQVLDLVNLTAHAGKPFRQLSLGNQQRLGLARALIGDPELLILDEPSNGLDPAGMREFRGLLRHLADDRGITVFMSSHLLGEVQQVADRIGIIHNGRLVDEVDRTGLEDLLREAGSLEAYFLRVTEGAAEGWAS